LAIAIKEHAGAGLVAVAAIAAAMATGLFEPTGYAAASIVIWAAVIAGLVGRVLPASRVGDTAAVAGLCLAGTALFATASIAWANDQGRAFEEAVRVSFYLGLFTLAACTASRGGRTQWLAGLATGLATVSLIALLSYLQPGLLGSQQSDIPDAAGRLSYPLGYWNGMAALMAAAAVLLCWGGRSARTRALRTAATALVPVAGVGIWLAGSRGGAVAVVAGLLVLVAASPDRRRQVVVIAPALAGTVVLILAGAQLDHLRSGLVDSARRADGDRMSAIVLGVVLATAAAAWLLDGRRLRLKVTRRMWAIAGALAVVVVVAGVAVANPAEKFREFRATPRTTAGVETGAGGVSSHGRWQYWTAAVDAFEGAPAEGLGAGGYENYWAQHAPVLLYARNPHSLPLQQAAELGIPGIILFGGFVIAAGVAIRRRLAAGREGDVGVLAAVLVAGAVGAAVDWTWEIPAAFGPAVVCAGLLTASAPSRRIARDGYWLGVAAVAAAWVAMVAGALVVLSELELKQSREAAASNHIQDAIDRARAARTVVPWSAEPYTQLALLEEQRGDFQQALSYLGDAEARDTDDWRLALIEARLQAERGDGSAAGMAIDRAHRLSPFSPLPFGGVAGQG
jgi:O-antigen ligase/polysaccharide polymerase Wzy-like membrane protein